MIEFYQTAKEVTEEQRTALDVIYDLAQQLAVAMQPEGDLSDTAERQYAISTLKDAVMWAVKHVAGESV